MSVGGAMVNPVHDVPTTTLIEAADLVSEIKEIKHPYEKGILAQRGIEY